MQSPLNVPYLDDGTIGGPAELAADLATLATALSAIGLELNPEKCEVFSAGPAPPPRVLALLRATLPGLEETQPSDLSLLGSPLTEAALHAATNKAAATINRMCDRISRLDAHTGLFFLAHYTAAPRLSYLLRSASLYREPGPLLAVDRTVRATLTSVTNVDIGDAAWEQASLPLRLGGLGVRSVMDWALPCHLASLHASLPLTHQILHGPDPCKPTPALQRALADVAKRHGGAAHLVSSAEKHKQRAWDETFAKTSRERLLEGANQVDRARLLASAEPHTAAWVQALPVANLGLHLDEDTIRVAVALRLGSAVCEPHPCQRCQHPVDRLGHHGLSCAKSAGRHARHANLNDVLRRSLCSAGLQSVLEPTGLDRGGGRRPDGMTIFPYSRGKSLVWDATCSDTFSATAVIQSALNPGSAARAAEERKRTRYAALCGRFAVETTGVLGPAAAGLMRELGRRLTASSGDRRETEHLAQRVSVAIVRGNAASVLATARPATDRRQPSPPGRNPPTPTTGSAPRLPVPAGPAPPAETGPPPLDLMPPPSCSAPKSTASPASVGLEQRRLSPSPPSPSPPPPPLPEPPSSPRLPHTSSPSRTSARGRP